MVKRHEELWTEVGWAQTHPLSQASETSPKAKLPI